MNLSLFYIDCSYICKPAPDPRNFNGSHLEENVTARDIELSDSLMLIKKEWGAF